MTRQLLLLSHKNYKQQKRRPLNTIPEEEIIAAFDAGNSFYSAAKVLNCCVKALIKLTEKKWKSKVPQIRQNGLKRSAKKKLRA